jgi:Uma2 family endonuclease
MGHITTQEALVLRWAELCADPRWHDLAGKIELNGRGVVETNPASNRHGIRQMAIGQALGLQLRHGTAIVECSVLTSDGVRVPDVAWASAAFMARHGDITPYPQAPEICVEVRSPSNTEAEMAYKTELFLAAGAVEVWIVDEEGGCQVFDSQGAQASSRFGVRLGDADHHPSPPA